MRILPQRLKNSTMAPTQSSNTRPTMITSSGRTTILGPLREENECRKETSDINAHCKSDITYKIRN